MHPGYQVVFDHPLFLLVIATMVVLVGFLVWNLMPVRRHPKTGGKTSGLGGPPEHMA